MDARSEVIKASVQAILELLNDSDTSESDFEEEDACISTSTCDLTTSLLIYASALGKNEPSYSCDDTESIDEIPEEKDEEMPPVTILEEAVEEEEAPAVNEQRLEKPEDIILQNMGPTEIKDLANVSDIDFKTHFRVSKSTVELLIGLLPEKTGLGRPHISDVTFVLVALWYLATQEPHNAIADRFKLGKSHSHRLVVDFCGVLTDLSSEYITWPDKHGAVEAIDTFKNTYGFPGVMGVLSNSRINIKCPAFDALNYCDASTGKYSVYLQTVVLPTLHFSFAFVGWPGSANDEEVLLKSPLYPKLVRDSSTWVPHASHLLSNCPFTLQTFLMTPYKDTGYLAPAQALYNQKHGEVCIVADYALGLLKNRFSRMLRMEVLKMDLLTKIITACCVLHNICLEEGDMYQDFIAESIQPIPMDLELASREAVLKRDTIANSFLATQC